MEATYRKLIAEFKACTHVHDDALQRIESMVLRGFPNTNLEPGLLNKYTEAQNATQVMNVLAYATQMVDLGAMEENGVASVEQELCLVPARHKKLFNDVVAQMPCLRFLLIPLTFAIKDGATWRLYSTLVIKTRSKGEDIHYIDMLGRVYLRFNNFLEENKLPFSVLCFPTEGAIEFDAQNRIMVSYRVVGMKNSLLSAADVLVTTFGLLGGFFMPLKAVTIGSGVYFTGRSVMELCDDAEHQKSVNPLKNPEAAVNWFQVAANIGSIAVIGVQQWFLLDEVFSAFKLSRCVNPIGTAARIYFTQQNLTDMALGDQISLYCCLCFMYREVITLENGKRLLREAQIQGVCNTLRNYTRGVFNLERCRALISNSVSTLRAALQITLEIARANISVELTEDFVTISLFEHTFQFANILRMDMDDIVKLIQVISALGNNFTDLLYILRRSFGDRPLIRLIAHRADELGGNYDVAANNIMGLFTAIRRIREDGLAAIDDVNMEVVLGAGHRFTMRSANDIFGGAVNLAQSLPLLRALLEMNRLEAERFNEFRAQLRDTVEEVELFRLIKAESNDSDRLLASIRARLP